MIFVGLNKYPMLVKRFVHLFYANINLHKKFRINLTMFNYITFYMLD
jgi:hypothetical protein